MGFEILEGKFEGELIQNWEVHARFKLILSRDGTSILNHIFSTSTIITRMPPPIWRLVPQDVRGRCEVSVCFVWDEGGWL